MINDSKIRKLGSGHRLSRPDNRLLFLVIGSVLCLVSKMPWTVMSPLTVELKILLQNHFGFFIHLHWFKLISRVLLLCKKFWRCTSYNSKPNQSYTWTMTFWPHRTSHAGKPLGVMLALEWKMALMSKNIYLCHIYIIHHAGLCSQLSTGLVVKQNCILFLVCCWSKLACSGWISALSNV